jgi:hypothetical protein
VVLQLGGWGETNTSPQKLNVRYIQQWKMIVGFGTSKVTSFYRSGLLKTITKNYHIVKYFVGDSSRK